MQLEYLKRYTNHNLNKVNVQQIDIRQRLTRRTARCQPRRSLSRATEIQHESIASWAPSPSKQQGGPHIRAQFVNVHHFSLSKHKKSEQINRLQPQIRNNWPQETYNTTRICQKMLSMCFYYMTLIIHSHLFNKTEKIWWRCGRYTIRHKRITLARKTKWARVSAGLQYYSRWRMTVRK